MTTTNDTSANRRIYRIPHAHILNLVRIAGIQGNGAVIIPRPLDLPEGAKVCSVQSNYSAQAFDYVVEHETFAAVPECEMLPVVKLELELFRIGKVDESTQKFMREAVNAETLKATVV